MKKILTGAIAALTVVGATAASIAPASAREWHGGGGYHRGGGDAVAAGILGLGIGAALAGGSHYYSGPGYYGRGYYYARPAYYGGDCRTEWRWSYRWGRYERVTYCY